MSWGVALRNAVGLGLGGIPSLLNAPPYAKLAFNFLSGQLDPRITFTRASNATLIGSDGKLQYAPHNLLTYSEQFDNAAWTKTQSTISSNSVPAPDGTTTADKVVEDTTASVSHYVQSPIITPAANISYASAVYVKAAERRYIAVTMTGGGGPDRGAFFDGLTGTYTGGFAGGLPYTVTNVGNGWFRYALTDTPTTAAAYALRVYACDVANNILYTGDGTSGIYVWGAQLNVGALQPYYSTTAKNLQGFSQEFDNVAWSKSNSFVQTNQIRNNTMQGAVVGAPGTNPTSWTIISGGGLSREITAIGTENGVSYIDVRFFGTGSSVSAQRVYTEATATVAAVDAQTWTFSAYVKVVAGTAPSGLFIGFDETGPGATYIRTDSASLPLTSTLTRNTYSATLTGGVNVAYVLPQIGFNSEIGVNVDCTIRIGLPQLVQGAVAGDPVPTYGTARAVMYSAPDGSVTADKLVEDTATIGHYLGPATTITGVVGQVLTHSCYVKAAERTFVQLILTGIAPASGNYIAGFDLSTGVAGTPTAGVTSRIVDVGNGWFRCSMTATVQTAANIGRQIRISLNSSSTPSSYTGDGTSGIYVWGAQFADSASLDPYFYNPGAAPTVASYYGPRFDYDPVTLAAKGLLIEEQRTNICLYSSDLSNLPWTYGGTVSLTYNTTTAPDGTITADTITVVSGADTGVYQNITCASSTTYTWSLYVKLGTMVASDYKIAIYDNTNLAFIAVDIVPTQTPSSTAWTRITYTFTTPATCVSVRPYCFRNSLSAATSVNVWGMQLEQGAFATSYIPTVAASLTRAADFASVTGANFSNWFNPVEGTIYTESSTVSLSATGMLTYAISDGTFNQSMYGNFTSGNTYRGANVLNGGVSQANSIASFTGLTTVNNTRDALAYKQDNFGESCNGVATRTDLTGTIPIVNRLYIGASWAGTSNFLNGYIRSFKYYPTRLSNGKLQTLTK